MRAYLLVMVIAAIVTYLLVPVVHRIALALGAITQIRARDVHTVPVARMGGLAMYIGFVVSLIIASQIPYFHRVLGQNSMAWAVALGAGLICFIGVLDDIYDLPWYAKLTGQMLTAGVMVWFGVQLVSLPLFGITVGSARLTLIVTILAVVVVVNAVNFIDGLDGLAAGVVGIAALSFFAYTYYLTRETSPGDFTSVACVLVAPLVGICAGFLPHNFHPARIFMGDSGALMLGTIIAGASIVVTGQIDPVSANTPQVIPAFMPLFVPLLVLVIPLIDFVWGVVRRLANGRSPFSADAGHLHHRLLRHGHSHTNAVIVLYMWTAVVSFSAVSAVAFPLKYVVPLALLGVVVAIVVTTRAFTRRQAQMMQHVRESVHRILSTTSTPEQ